MNKKTNSGLKIICLNRKASFNYFFEDLLEAGIVLKGSEIKSIRDGKVNIADNVYIGIGSSIRDNVNIGSNVVIGAHSNVTKNIEENSILATNDDIWDEFIYFLKTRKKDDLLKQYEFLRLHYHP